MRVEKPMCINCKNHDVYYVYGGNCRKYRISEFNKILNLHK